MIETGLLRPTEAYKWNRVVERSAHAQFYHLWEWGEVLSSIYGHQRYYLVAKQNGDFVGVFPLIHVKSMLFGNRLISLPFCEYGGPLVDWELDTKSAHNVINKLLDASNRLAVFLGAEYVEFRGFPSTVEPELVHSQGYINLQRYVTFQVNLEQPKEVLWRSLEKKTRNATRKAEKMGVKTVEAKRVEQLGSYYMLYLKTQKRHGSPPHAYSLFQNLFEIFYPQGKMKITLAEFQGTIIAGIMTFLWGNTIYWSSNVTDIEHRHLNPTNLLLWKTIEYGSSKRNKVLDLGRTRPDTTIYHFKKGWGGKEVKLNDYIRFSRSVKMLPDPNQRKYLYLSKLWSLIPVSASRYFGPHIVSAIAL